MRPASGDEAHDLPKTELPKSPPGKSEMIGQTSRAASAPHSIFAHRIESQSPTFYFLTTIFEEIRATARQGAAKRAKRGQP
jgi:hypothetical protein